MSHLPAERLAALADHDPTPAEAEHLALCTACCRERDTYRSLVATSAAERDVDAVPLLGWEALAARLRSERLLVDDPTLTAPITADAAGKGRAWRAWPRVAAAVVLLAGGVVAGRLSATVGPFAPAPVAGGEGMPAPAAIASAEPSGALAFASQAEASQAMLRAERVYQAASAYLARSDSATFSEPDPDTYRTRLAALDEVAEATREALRESPHDPVINRYYLTTLGARQATLQQLGGALANAQGYRLTRF